MLIRLIAALVTVAAMNGCSPPAKSPSEIYLEYQTRSAEGLTFDEDMSYWSSARVETVDEKIVALATRMEKSREEAVEFYLDLSKRTAACSEFELLEERVEDREAYLELLARDICQPDLVDPSTHKVKLVLERSWKIDDVEVVL
jgi:hypothetical protein